MDFRKAQKEHMEQIYELVQTVIKTVYPHYYPKEVVDFFCEHHSKENISADINNGFVWILLIENCLAGTGSCMENHITRVFVEPNLQGRGYGSYIMQCLENKVAATQTAVSLDASLPASPLYEHRGYKTVTHKKLGVQNGAFLVYEIMEKQLS